MPEDWRHFRRKIEAIFPFNDERILSKQLVELTNVTRSKELRKAITMRPSSKLILKLIHGRPFFESLRIKKLPLHIEIERPLGLGNGCAGKDKAILEQRTHRHDHGCSST